MPPLLLLGGTFDPPHIGHLLLAECARTELGALRVVFLPAGDPYRKTDPQRAAGTPRTVTRAEHRVAMLRLALRGDRTAAIDDRETRRDGPTFTVDTLRALHDKGHPDIVLILGSDALADLPNWHDPEGIAALCRLAVATNTTPTTPPALPPAIAARVVPLTSMPPLAISSTLVRQRVAAGLPIHYLVPEPVERYIRQHALYRDPPP